MSFFFSDEKHGRRCLAPACNGLITCYISDFHLFYCFIVCRGCDIARVRVYFFLSPSPPLPPLSLFNKGFFRRIFWTDEKSRNDSSLFFLGRRGGKTNILKSWRKIEEDRLVVRTFNSFRFRDTSKKSKKFYYFSFQCSLNINCPCLDLLYKVVANNYPVIHNILLLIILFFLNVGKRFNK